MRLFQNNGLSRGFRAHRPRASDRSFGECLNSFLDTRYAASHILQPVLAGSAEAFYTNGDDETLQRLWARDNGLAGKDLEQILLAQIEHHRTEVFYNLDPMSYGSAFIRQLPGCVRRSICWRAAPSGSADLSGYDLVVCNFPSILDSWREKGCRVAYFIPAHDPVMDGYAAARRENVDLLFVGGFSRHHRARVAALTAAASVPRISARLHLEDSRLTRLANLLPFLPLLSAFCHPAEIRRVRADPLYGRELYAAMASARIVLNGAVDMAGEDRGNMRCFEAVGCGAVLLTDAGHYPEGFAEGETMVTYASVDQIPRLVERLIADADWASAIATAGNAMVRDRYSKERQWARFQELCN
ncbi:glycosyltransferase family protein [Bradyrhizobium sp.]|uniref:glycosyltransferase family protein n=1 Tax=Bradyrhizobium sp. TaxID=376 RepID=UPI0040378B22